MRLPDNLQDGTLGDNLTTYGWVWLGVGILLIVSSFLVLTRSQFARWIGLIAAGIMGLSAMTWMPYYPIWALTYVAHRRAGVLRPCRAWRAHAGVGRPTAEVEVSSIGIGVGLRRFLDLRVDVVTERQRERRSSSDNAGHADAAGHGHATC